MLTNHQKRTHQKKGQNYQINYRDFQSSDTVTVSMQSLAIITKNWWNFLREIENHSPQRTK